MLKPASLLRCLGCLLFLLSPPATRAQETVFPGRDWLEATPESQGLDAAKLRAAVKFLEEHAGSDGVRELVIIRHGRLIWKGDDIDKRHGVWSCTKSFTSTVLGLLAADGKCSPDTHAAELVPELKAVYPEVTLRHFTTMTSGYRAVGDETTGSYKHGPSKTPFQPNPQPLFTPPGSQYAYWDSAMNVFGLALTRAAGEPMEELFRRRIAEPIGMKDWDWGDHSQDRDVVVNGGSGNGGTHIHITAREMARFGHLYLNGGNWSGRQLLPREWVRQATALHVPASLPWAQPESEIDGRGCYGFNWWVNGVKADGKRLWPGAPEGTFAASGHNNNRCFVIPEWGMVVVRLGLDQKDRKVSDETWGAFLGRIGGAMMALAQAGPETAAGPGPVKPVQRGFQNRVFKDAQGVERKYVLFVPYRLEAGARPPLLMFLHGSGERGDNGLDQVMVGLGPALWKQKANFPFITIFPQCHTNGNWLVDGPDAQAALAMFRAVAAEFNTDPDRAYLTGLSMGGSGSWSIAAKHPDMFAAIVPMCGRGELSSAKTLAAARLPVWNFCGDKDREATVQFCRDMHAALQAAGGSSQYTEYPGVGHNCWDNAYGTAELYKWLLEQSRTKNRR